MSTYLLIMQWLIAKMVTKSGIAINLLCGLKLGPGPYCGSFSSSFFCCGDFSSPPETRLGNSSWKNGDFWSRKPPSKDHNSMINKNEFSSYTDCLKMHQSWLKLQKSFLPSLLTRLFVASHSNTAPWLAPCLVWIVALCCCVAPCLLLYVCPLCNVCPMSCRWWWTTSPSRRLLLKRQKIIVGEKGPQLVDNNEQLHYIYKNLLFAPEATAVV